MAEYASKGVAGSGLGLGIAGLSVALLNGANNCNGGILGGLFGNRCCGEGGMQVLVSEQASQIARLSAEKYADHVGINTFKESLAAMDKRFDENRARIGNLEAVVAQSAVREAELRGEIRNLTTYINGTFVPGRLVMPATAICPEVMPRYNSYTAPTDTAPATQPVTGTVQASRRG